MKLSTVLVFAFGAAVMASPFPEPEPYPVSELGPRGACTTCGKDTSCCIGKRDTDSALTCYPICTGAKKNICGKECIGKRSADAEPVALPEGVFEASKLDPRGFCNLCENKTECCTGRGCNPVCKNNVCKPVCPGLARS